MFAFVCVCVCVSLSLSLSLSLYLSISLSLSLSLCACVYMGVWVCSCECGHTPELKCKHFWCLVAMWLSVKIFFLVSGKLPLTPFISQSFP